jgi:uncharacterized protein (DUF433 family)
MFSWRTCLRLDIIGVMRKVSAIIKVDPEIQGGTPCFAGTRVPARTLFDYLARGRSLNYFLEQFPSVKRDQAIRLLERAGKRIARDSRAA